MTRLAAALWGCALVAAVLLGALREATARSCTDQNGACVSTCMTFGIGRQRKSNPHPMSADFCRRHCAGWYSGCMASGCWNGDLARLCGLSKD